MTHRGPKPAQHFWRQAEFLRELSALISKLGSKSALARALEVSPSKISFWSEEDCGKKQLIPTKEDALKLGVLAANLFQRPKVEETRKWLEITGRYSPEAASNLDDLLRGVDSLEGKATQLFDSFALVAQRKGLREEESMVALSAYYSQRAHRLRLKSWIDAQDEKAVCLFFVAWNEGELLSALEQQSLQSMLREHFELLLGSNESIQLKGFVSGSDEVAGNQIWDALLRYEIVSDRFQNRFELFVPGDERFDPIDNVADAWVYLGGHSFGILVAKSHKLLRSVALKLDSSIETHPWWWALQVSALEFGSDIEDYKPFLRSRGVTVSLLATIETPGWRPVNRSKI